MQGEISFAGKVAFNIKMDDVKKRLLEDLEHNFNFRVIQKHYDKYSDHVIGKLNNNPHLVSVRTNGNPYLLYLTKFHYVNQCIFVDKKIQQGYCFPRIILTKFRFDDSLFEGGTVFDGEMVKDSDGNWIYIINDVFGHKGVYLENVNLVRRLNLIYEILDKSYIPDEFDVCKFQVKKYIPYQGIEDMLTEFVPKLKYTCRGIYFKPLFLKFKDILMNFDDSLIQKVLKKKYKSVSNFLLMEDSDALQERTVANVRRIPFPQKNNEKDGENNIEKEKEFYVKKTNQPDVYEIMGGATGPPMVACIPSLKTSKMMRMIFADKNITDKVLMLCQFNDKFGKWTPMKASPVSASASC